MMRCRISNMNSFKFQVSSLKVQRLTAVWQFESLRWISVPRHIDVVSMGFDQER